MTTYTDHKLSPMAEACGVTLKDVARVLPLTYFNFGEAWCALPENTPPALAAEVARCGLDLTEVEFGGLNTLGHPLYRAARA